MNFTMKLRGKAADLAPAINSAIAASTLTGNALSALQSAGSAMLTALSTYPVNCDTFAEMTVTQNTTSGVVEITQQLVALPAQI